MYRPCDFRAMSMHSVKESDGPERGVIEHFHEDNPMSEVYYGASTFLITFDSRYMHRFRQSVADRGRRNECASGTGIVIVESFGRESDFINFSLQRAAKHAAAELHGNNRYAISEQHKLTYFLSQRTETGKR